MKRKLHLNLLIFINGLIDAIITYIIIIILLFCTYALISELNIGDEPYIEALKPLPNEPVPDYHEINNDYVSWLTIDDTSIDYPVVQTTDNEYYVEHDFFGEYAVSGTIFLDYRNDSKYGDTYSIVYGHHLAEGQYVMFSDVARFLEEEYFNTHETGMLKLDNINYELEVFACGIASNYESTFYNVSNYENNALTLVDSIEHIATNYRELEWEDDDNILALSTCQDYASPNRIILFCKIIE